MLGNHEFWEFPGQNMDEIVATYQKVIEDNGMYLLHNEILYENPDQEFHIIPYEELITVSSETLKRRLQRTRLVILGVQDSQATMKALMQIKEFIGIH